MHGDPTLCPRDAQALDRSIVAKLEALAGTSAEFYEVAGKMRDTFAYKHLGFDQWEDYLSDRTAGYSVLKRSREYLVWLLSEDGRSNRDIAEKLGVDEATVRRDLKRQVRQNAAPDGKIKGKDGKLYPRPTLVPDVDDDDEVEDNNIIDVEVEEPEEDSLATARKREKKPNPFTCDVDTWDESFVMFRTMLRNGISALLSNPTHAQALQMEALVRKELLGIVATREEIESIHARKQQAAQ